MSKSSFKHVIVRGIKTSIPERFIDIDEEIQYFDNNPRRLARQKAMVGYGRRYIADELTSVTDMAVDAAKKLLSEIHVAESDVESVIFVNQSPDYIGPADACIAHGMLNLKKTVPCFSINLGCSGYI